MKTTKMKKTIILVVVLIGSALAVMRLNANRERNVSQKENLTADYVMVSVANVEKKSSAFTLSLTGSLYPDKELDIAAETSGKINAIKYKLGQHFSKGGVIATIDDKIKRLSYESAKIEAERLKKDFERVANLYKGDASSEQDYALARSAYETAKNKCEEAEKQLSYTKITAPIAGTITKKLVEEGKFIKEGESVASIVDVARLKVKVNVSESNIYYLHPGDRAKITTDIYPGIAFNGTISFVSPRGDDTHNYAVEIEIVNSAANPLKAGTFVNVEVGIDSKKNALYIPRKALQGSIKEAKVYVASNDKAYLKDIVIGREDNESLEVLSGLTEKDRVIVSGQVNLTDSKSIKIIDNK